MSTNGILLVIVVFIYAFAHWFMSRQYKPIPSYLTEQERQVVSRQHGIILLAFLSLVLMFFPNIKWQWLWPIGAAALLYTGISSMKNRVSVIRFHGQYQPTKGTLAFGFGIILTSTALIILYLGMKGIL